MIFCGRTFCGSRNCFDYTSNNIENIDEIILKNGIYDEMYVTKNITYEYTNKIQDNWDFDTILYPKFNGDLLGGNINFVIEQIDSIRIKRQESGSNKWITIFEMPIEKEEDFKFAKLDKYVRSNTLYEYALVPVLNNSEGDMNINSVFCEFDGIFIMEKDLTYGTVIDISMSTTKNRPSSVVNTISSKFPFVITNGNNNYFSGSVTATFIKSQDGTYNWDYYNSTKYREEIMDFFCNGKPKILKHYDGRMYIISIINNPSQDESVSSYYPTTTFEWVEIGDADNSQDLYDNGLIDYNNRYIDAISTL